MKIDFLDTKLIVKTTKEFNKNYKKILRQGKDVSKLHYVVNKIANGERLDLCYRNHKLVDDGIYKNCYECHISPDWLLICRYDGDNLVLVLINTGSHSDLFK